MKRRRLQWFGHICRRDKEDDIRKVHEMKVAGKGNRGCPKHRWHDNIRKSLQSFFLNKEDAQDRVRLRSLISLGLLAAATRYPNRSKRR